MDKRNLTDEEIDNLRDDYIVERARLEECSDSSPALLLQCERTIEALRELLQYRRTHNGNG